MGPGIYWGWLLGAAMLLTRYHKQVLKLWQEYGVEPTGNQWALDLIRESSFRSSPNIIQGWALDNILTQVSRASILSYLRYSRISGRSFSFLQLSLLTQGMRCTDPRDHIFALWNLATEPLQSLMTPDYTKRVGEVYTEFTKVYANYHHCLDIICSTQFPMAAQSSPHIPEPPNLSLPSWCPDWRQHRFVGSFIRPSAPLPGYATGTLPTNGISIVELPGINQPKYHASSLHPLAGDLDTPSQPCTFRFDHSCLVTLESS